MQLRLRSLLSAILFLAGAGIASAQYTDATWVRGGNSQPVVSMSYSQNNRYIASVGLDGAIRVWDVVDNRLYRYIRSLGVNAVAFHPDNTRLVAVTSTGSVTIYDINTGAEVRTIPSAHSSTINWVEVTPNGNYFVTGAEDNLVKIWNMSDGSLVRGIIGHVSGVTALAISADNARVVSISRDRTIRVSNMADGQLVKSWTDSTFKTGVAISSDGRYAVAGRGNCFNTSTGCGVGLYDASTGAVVKTWGPHRLDVNGVAMSPNGKYIASAGSDGAVWVYRADSTSLAPMIRIRHQAGARDYIVANRVRFSPDGKYLASGSDDKTIRIWDIAAGTSRVLIDSAAAITSVVAHAGSGNIVVGRRDGMIHIRDAATGNLVKALAEITETRVNERYSYVPGPPIRSVDMGPGGTVVAAGREDGSVVIWNTGAGTITRTIAAGSTVNAVAFSPGGEKLATAHGSPDNVVKIWNVATGALLKTLTGHTAGVNDVAWGPNGAYVVSGSADYSVIVWDPTTGTPTRTLSGHNASVLSLALSNDGSYLATTDADTIRVWGMPSGMPISYATGHSQQINDVGFSADGNYVLSVSDDGTMKVWRASSGHNLYTYSEYTGQQAAVAVEGGTIYTGTNEGMVISWPLKSPSDPNELSAPMLAGPADNTANISVPLVAYWNRAAGATSYRIQVSTEQSFTTGLVYEQDEVTDSLVDLATLLSGTTYYWRVRGESALGNSPWSTTWRFATAGASGSILAPSLANPTNGATEQLLSLLLSWNIGTGAEWYGLQVATSSTFSSDSRVVDESRVDSTSFNVTGLLKNTKYYWRVRSRDSQSRSSSWSDVWSFTTANPTSVDNQSGSSAVGLITVSPNPARDAATLHVQMLHGGNLHVRIVDALGRTVAVIANQQLNAGDHAFAIRTSALDAGTYFVETTMNGGVHLVAIQVVR